MRACLLDIGQPPCSIFPPLLPLVSPNVGITIKENVVPIKTNSTTDICSNIGGKWMDETEYRELLYLCQQQH